MGAGDAGHGARGNRPGSRVGPLRERVLVPRHVPEAGRERGEGGGRQDRTQERAGTLRRPPGSSGSSRNDAQRAPFVQFAREARAGRKLMFVSHSSIIPPGYASTTET